MVSGNRRSWRFLCANVWIFVLPEVAASFLHIHLRVPVRSTRAQTVVVASTSIDSNKESAWPGCAPDFDADQWVQWCSDSLQRFTGASLFQKLNLPEGDTQQLHANTRYLVLSHGTEEDPIYCYFNRAALDAFERDPQEISSLPSRYSAPPEGRTPRTALLEDTLQNQYQQLPPLIRVTKTGQLFRVPDVVLWNIYNDQGDLVGQTACADRTKIVPITQEEYEATL